MVCAALLDSTVGFMGGKSVRYAHMRRKRSFDSGHQQLGVDPTHTFAMWKEARPCRAKKSSSCTKQHHRSYVKGTTQVPIEAGGRVLSVGHDNGLHSKYRQFTVHPAVYGANVGTLFFGMVRKAPSKQQVAPPRDRSRLPRHCVYSCNDFRCTYYHTTLIKEGVVTWGQCLEADNSRFLNFMPRT